MDCNSQIDLAKWQNIKYLCRIADKKVKLKNFQEALDYYQKIKPEIGKDSKTSKIYADTLCHVHHSLSKIYIKQNNIAKAKKELSKASKIANKWQSRHQIATNLDIQSDIMRLEGQYDKAISHLERSLEIKVADQRSKPLELSMTYHRLGKIYYDVGKYDVALVHYKKALHFRMLSETVDADTTRIFHDMGFIYSNQGDYDVAAEMYQKALKAELTVKSEYQDNTSIASTFWCLGVVFSQQGKYNKALSMHLSSLEIKLCKLENDPLNIAKSYYYTGLVYCCLYQYDQALNMHLKALEIRLEKGKDNHIDLALSYEEIGVNYYRKMNYPKALIHYRSALNIRSQYLHNNHFELAKIYNAIGMVYRKQSQYDEAIKLHNKAITILVDAVNDDVNGKYQNLIHTISQNLSVAIDHQSQQDTASDLYDLTDSNTNFRSRLGKANSIFRIFLVFHSGWSLCNFSLHSPSH